MYDASETYIYMRKTWMDYFAGRITIEDVCRQYDKAGVDVIVDGKDNMDEKTREVAYIRMYHFGWNFRQLGCHML